MFYHKRADRRRASGRFISPRITPKISSLQTGNQVVILVFLDLRESTVGEFDRGPSFPEHKQVIGNRFVDNYGGYLCPPTIWGCIPHCLCCFGQMSLNLGNPQNGLFFFDSLSTNPAKGTVQKAYPIFGCFELAEAILKWWFGLVV